jgi:EAL domain-containing protein (putative c-di-GMP-specific phosphodiesterase class I)
VSLTTGTPIGLEALVRWRHTSLGVISPVDFIPIAERTGAIVPLGRWILQEACRQLKEWESAAATPAGVWVSVNVSGVQLRDPRFADLVAEVLRDSGLAAGRLVLELTEGVAMHDPAAVRTLLMRLRADGVRISIDDFGTGYSSLAYLRQLPVDGVKIDQSFVRRLGEDHDTAVIVTAIMTMAKELSLSVVAEGVETETQRARLEELECASAQGYLFAEPLVPADALTFLQGGTTGDLRMGGTAGGADAAARVPGRRTPVLMRIGRGAAAAGATAIVVACAGIGALWFRSQPLPAPHVLIPVESADPALEAPVAAAATEHADTPRLGGGGEAPSPAAVADASTVAVQTQTFPVIHRHRLGECRGRLTLSPRGVAFTADKGAGDDAFSWNANAFTHTADRKTVTIRAEGRTYRFESGVERVAARPGQIDTISRALAQVRP